MEPNLIGFLTILVVLSLFLLSFPSLRDAAAVPGIDPVLTRLYEEG